MHVVWSVRRGEVNYRVEGVAPSPSLFHCIFVPSREAIFLSSVFVVHLGVFKHGANNPLQNKGSLLSHDS